MKNEILNILLAKKIIEKSDIYEAESFQKKSLNPGSILSTLIFLKKAKPEAVADAVAKHYGLEMFDSLEKIDPPAVVSPELARKYKVFPVKVEDNILYLAMDDPSNIEVSDAISLATGFDVIPVVCTAKEIEQAIQRCYGATDGLDEDTAEPVEILNSPAVATVQEIIENALSDNISDIHIEPTKNRMIVRFRQDGMLRVFQEYSKRLHTSVISRLKVMAGLNITESRVAQDGRIQLTEPREVDLRVSILPTIYGEKVVMRIFDKMRVIPDLESLGYDEETLNRLKKAVKAPYGMILVTGPTGSGKTTTLYAILSRLVSSNINVVAVEDPPEYSIAGINHVAVNPKVGMSFANILRAILRQDPDIIMVGEIRDNETARVAVQAAMTGHLVLSTLHTNNAVSAPVRLIDMGVEPYHVASSLLSVVAQRLVRKVCPKCKEICTIEKNSPAYMFMEGKVTQIVHADGCFNCNYTGYKGRTAIAEVLSISPSIRDLIRSNEPADEIQRQAVHEGMEPLIEKARRKVESGLITVEDAMKNVYTG